MDWIEAPKEDKYMPFKGIFGNNIEAKIYEQFFIAGKDAHLTSKYLSRKIEVSEGTVLLHIRRAIELGVINRERKGTSIFYTMNNSKFWRAIAMINNYVEETI